MSGARWRARPEGSNWGEFGQDDKLGRLNLLTPQRVIRAMDEIKTGFTFCLSLPLNYPGGQILSPHRAPPCIHAIDPDGRPRFNFRSDEGRSSNIESDDWVSLSLQYSTHWDSLAHIGEHFDADADGVAEAVYYNGFRAGEHVTTPSGIEGDRGGALSLGIETMAERCIQGRGVLIDLHAHLGTLDGPKVVTWNILEAILQADKISVEEGDIVCLHTGVGDAILAMDMRPDSDRLAARDIALDGRDQGVLDWITETGLVALVADNFAVESYPARPAQYSDTTALPLHSHCLFKLGIPLGELWYLGDLARWLRRARRSRFMLTAPPLRLPGAVGSPVTPVATV